MKKILLISNTDSDIYCFRKEIIEELSLKYDVYICCTYGEYVPLMKDLKVSFVFLDIDRRGTNFIKELSLIRKYKRIIKNIKPDLILTFSSKPNAYCGRIAKKNHIPYISNVTGFGSAFQSSFLKQQVIKKMFRHSLRHANCVLFQNENNLLFAKNNGFVKDNYRLLPGSGVNTDRFPLLKYPDGGNGITGAPIVFNYIGRILKEKGIDDYLVAASNIKRNFPNVIFNVIGPIEKTEMSYDEVLKKYQNEGVIVYKGNMTNVIDCISQSHALILPSYYGEGISNSLLENASCGRVLITTDNHGCMETVIEGKTGWIFKQKDTNSLILIIKHFLSLKNETRKLMGINGREYVKKAFNRKVVVETYAEEIEKALSNSL